MIREITIAVVLFCGIILAGLLTLLTLEQVIDLYLYIEENYVLSA